MEALLQVSRIEELARRHAYQENIVSNRSVLRINGDTGVSLMKAYLFTLALFASAMNLSARADSASLRPERMIFATVGWSEWCPPGQVTVNFYSGQYRWVVQNARPNCQGATTTELRSGKLTLAQLVAVQEATERVLKDGINRPECRSGFNPSNAVISNAAGPYFLVISANVGSVSTAGDLGCWSDASVALQRLLGDIFDRKALEIKKPIGGGKG